MHGWHGMHDVDSWEKAIAIRKLWSSVLYVHEVHELFTDIWASLMKLLGASHGIDVFLFVSLNRQRTCFHI